MNKRCSYFFSYNLVLKNAKQVCESYWSSDDRKGSIFKVLRAVKAIQNGIKPEDLDLTEIPEAILNKRLQFEKSSSSGSKNGSKSHLSSSGHHSSSKKTKHNNHVLPKKNCPKIEEEKNESAGEEENELRAPQKLEKETISAFNKPVYEEKKEEFVEALREKEIMECFGITPKGNGRLEEEKIETVTPQERFNLIESDGEAKDEDPGAYCMGIGAMLPPEDEAEPNDNGSKEEQRKEEEPSRTNGKTNGLKDNSIEEEIEIIENGMFKTFKQPEEKMNEFQDISSKIHKHQKSRDASPQLAVNGSPTKSEDVICSPENGQDEFDEDEILRDFLVIETEEPGNNISFVNEEHFPLQQRHRTFEDLSLVAQSSKELTDLLGSISPSRLNGKKEDRKRAVITKYETMREGIMGMKNYILFTIVIDGKDDQAVQRRYSEFSKFHEFLSSMVAFQGMILPELPDKVYLTNYGEATLRDRKKKLEKYLCTLINSPVFGDNEYVKRFLEEKNRTKFLDWFKNIQHLIGISNKSYSLKMSEYIEFVKVKTSMLMVVKKNSVEEMNKLAEVKEKMTYIEKAIFGLEEIYDKVVEKNSQTYEALFSFVEGYKHQTQDFDFARIKDCVSITASCFQIVDDRNNFEAMVQKKLKKLGNRFRKINDEISKLYRINSEYVTSVKYKQNKEKGPQALDFQKTAAEIEDYLRLLEQRMRCICSNLMVEIKILVLKR